MRQTVTTLLDACGLGLLAAGAGTGVSELVGLWAGLLAAGGVLIGGSVVATRVGER